MSGQSTFIASEKSIRDTGVSMLLGYLADADYGEVGLRIVSSLYLCLYEVNDACRTRGKEDSYIASD